MHRNTRSMLRVALVNSRLLTVIRTFRGARAPLARVSERHRTMEISGPRIPRPTTPRASRLLTGTCSR